MSAPQDLLAAHVAGTRSVPPAVAARVKTFLLDTLGVGIAGSSGAGVEGLVRLARSWGPGQEATVWLGRERLSAGSAAIVNAYQIHCLEFDCVHEGAVLHPMATVLSAVLVERAEGLEAAPAILAQPRVARAMFGGVDHAAKMGVPVAPDTLAFARARLLHAARLAQVDLLDVPCLAFRDEAAVAEEARAARRMGFSGKAALHPANVAAVNAAFAPSPEEVETAQRIVALHDPSPGGLGELDGKLIEKPVVLAMRRLLAQAQP